MNEYKQGHRKRGGKRECQPAVRSPPITRKTEVGVSQTSCVLAAAARHIDHFRQLMLRAIRSTSVALLEGVRKEGGPVRLTSNGKFYTARRVVRLAARETRRVRVKRMWGRASRWNRTAFASPGLRPDPFSNRSQSRKNILSLRILIFATRSLLVANDSIARGPYCVAGYRAANLHDTRYVNRYHRLLVLWYVVLSPPCQSWAAVCNVRSCIEGVSCRSSQPT